jgi:hypothetical protein
MYMQIKDVNGVMHDVEMTEAKRFFHEVRRYLAQHGSPEQLKHETEHENHKFHIGGNEVSMTVGEMKAVADAWWEHYGKSKMAEFFTEYQKKAGENIAAALNCEEPPKNEPEVKGAITMALECGNKGIAGEVIFEAMEWCYAYAGLESIGD